MTKAQKSPLKSQKETVGKGIGYTGNTLFDTSKPDGTIRTLMNASMLNKMGRKANVGLHSGLVSAYDDILIQTINTHKQL